MLIALYMSSTYPSVDTSKDIQLQNVLFLKREEVLITCITLKVGFMHDLAMFLAEHGHYLASVLMVLFPVCITASPFFSLAKKMIAASSHLRSKISLPL